MATRVYVAGGFKYKSLVNEVQEMLRGLGYAISHDWTAFEHADADRTVEECARYSELDMEGVRSADFVVAVFNDNDYPYRGTFAELGGAIIGGKRVYVLDLMGPEADAGIRQTPFFHDKATRRVRSLDQLRNALGH